MHHSYYKDRISAWHDMGLPVMEQELIGQHLATCQECQALLEQFQKLDALVARESQLGDSDYWESAAHKIDQAIEGGKVEKSSKLVTRLQPVPYWKWMAAAASILLVSVVGFNYLKENPEPKFPAPKVRVPAVTSSPTPMQLSDTGVTLKKAQSQSVPASPDAEESDRAESIGIVESVKESSPVRTDQAATQSEGVPIDSKPETAIQKSTEPAPAVAGSSAALMDSIGSASNSSVGIQSAGKWNAAFQDSKSPAISAARPDFDSTDSNPTISDFGLDQQIDLYWSLFTDAQTSGRFENRTPVGDSIEPRESIQTALADSTLHLLTLCFQSLASGKPAGEDSSRYRRVIAYFSDDRRPRVADSARTLLAALDK